MNFTSIKHLLDQVEAVSSRYKEINQVSGENFNVFKILKLQSSEVRMHSAFLAELLNPRGSHGQGSRFLKIFIERFCDFNKAFDTQSCKVEIEKHIGYINEDRTEGGRIDLILSDKNGQHIIIENKIYAGDQYNQLVRYHKYSPNAYLIYLTLDGKAPDHSSFGALELGKHYYCYSYKRDVVAWLDDCRKEVAIYPVVREGLTHYINLIKSLTKQTLNHNMEQEVSNLLKRQIEAAWVISENLDSACQKVADEFFQDLVQHYVNKGYHASSDIDFEEQWSGFYLWKDGWKHISIAFQFESFDKGFFYGFLLEDPEKQPIKESLAMQLAALPNNNSKNSWWPWRRQLESPYENWGTLEAWQAVLDGRMKSMIIDRADSLIALTQNIDVSTHQP